MKATKTASRLWAATTTICPPCITTGITTRPLWFALPAVLVLLYVWTLTDFPLDYWHHLNAGRQMTQTGSLAQTETFSHTAAGRTVVNQNWLVQLSAYQLHRLGGFQLLQTLAGIGYAIAFGLITALASRRCGNVRVAGFAAAAALFLAITNFGIRPQALSIALFAIELYALWCWPGKRRLILIVAVVEIVWTNTHGAFPLGVVLPGIFATAALWTALRRGDGGSLWKDPVARVYVVCTLLGVAAMFCNPFPSRTAEYVLGVMANSSQRQIGEWLPTSFGSITGKAFFASLAATLAVLGAGRRRLDPVELLLLVSFMLLGATAQRMVIWWALVMVPVLSRHLVTIGTLRTQRAAAGERSPVNLLFAAGLIVVVGWSTPWTRTSNLLLPPGKRVARPADEPSGVVEFLKSSGYQGKMLNTMSWGAYLSWHLDPRVKVFIDGRMEVFPEKVWQDFVAIGRLSGDWQAKLDEYEIEWVVWNERRSNVLPAALDASRSWRRVYSDGLAAVFVRVDRSGPGDIPKSGTNHSGPSEKPVIIARHVSP